MGRKKIGRERGKRRGVGRQKDLEKKKRGGPGLPAYHVFSRFREKSAGLTEGGQPYVGLPYETQAGPKSFMQGRKKLSRIVWKISSLPLNSLLCRDPHTSAQITSLDFCRLEDILRPRT